MPEFRQSSLRLDDATVLPELRFGSPQLVAFRYAQED